jgi:hypothetical protein
MSNHVPLHLFEIVFYSTAALFTAIGVAWVWLHWSGYGSSRQRVIGSQMLSLEPRRHGWIQTTDSTGRNSQERLIASFGKRRRIVFINDGDGPLLGVLRRRVVAGRYFPFSDLSKSLLWIPPARRHFQDFRPGGAGEGLSVHCSLFERFWLLPTFTTSILCHDICFWDLSSIAGAAEVK